MASFVVIWVPHPARASGKQNCFMGNPPPQSGLHLGLELTRRVWLKSRAVKWEWLLPMECGSWVSNAQLYRESDKNQMRWWQT